MNWPPLVDLFLTRVGIVHGGGTINTLHKSIVSFADLRGFFSFQRHRRPCTKTCTLAIFPLGGTLLDGSLLRQERRHKTNTRKREQHKRTNEVCIHVTTSKDCCLLRIQSWTRSSRQVEKEKSTTFIRVVSRFVAHRVRCHTLHSSPPSNNKPLSH